MQFHGHDLRRAMRAARTVLRPRSTSYTAPCCRLTNGDVFALARMTDGHRVVSMRVRREPQKSPVRFDEPLSPKAVRALAATSGPWVDVGTLDDVEHHDIRIRAGADPTRYFDAGQAADAASLDRVLNSHGSGGPIADLERKAALAKLQKRSCRS